MGHRAAGSWRRALALAALVVVVRSAWAGWTAHDDPSSVRSSDTPSYVDSARALVDDGEFDVAPDVDAPMFVRTPGYPMVLAGILWTTPESAWAPSAVQAGLSASIVLLTYGIGRRLLGPGGALAAAAIVALDPLQFAASGTLLTESVATLSLLVVMAAAAPVLGARRRTVDPVACALLGLALAGAAMVRPTAYFFPVVAAGFVVLATRPAGIRRVVVSLVALAVPLVLVVGGWQLRNHHAVGSWRFSGIDAINLYCFRAADVDARVRGTSFEAERSRRGCAAEDPVNERSCPAWWGREGRDLHRPGACYDEMAERGLDTLASHPVPTAIVTARGFVRVAFGPGTDTVARFLRLSSHRALTALLGAWTLGLWIAFALGAASLARERGPDGLLWGFAMAWIGYVLVVSSGTEAYARFRTPVVPLIALVAGAAGPSVRSWRGGPPRPRVRARADLGSAGGP
jgi:4-amino-4-deoxy-L-arabinose transferase-like glycosyltransferase